MQRRMEDPNGNGGIDEDILLMFEEEDSHEKLRLPPTLTLYTGQRLIPSPPHHPSNNHKPSVNLHLSLGGSYSNSSTNTTTHHHAAAVDNNNIVINASPMMKKSYLDQNNNLDQMPPAPQKEIILIDDDDRDIDWAARSASENRALLRALHIIKSESCTTSTTTHHKRKTWSFHPYNQGVVFQEEVGVEGGIGNSMMNPDDFLSINLDDDDNNINAFKDYISSSSSSSSSTTSPPENNIRLLFPTHHDSGKSAPPNPNYYHCYYYKTNNNNIAPQGGALLGSTKSAPSCTRKENPMHCHDHDHTYMAAAPPFAFASNQWSNVPISGPRFPMPGALLMKKNECVRDSEIEMIRHMPTVTTDGGIPGGRRIEGFLYRYSKYEDVIIVCCCHGSFFTPKQFVMHAAAGVTAIEFQNPMRLITILSDD